MRLLVPRPRWSLMYVTQHARDRIADRLGEGVADGYVELLEQHYSDEYGTHAYLLRLPAPVRADDGSNGNVLVVIAVDGSVETVYFRRADQDLSPAYFGARRVHDMRGEVRYDEDEYEVKGEARTSRVDNRRKMKVTGRSTLLLSALASGQQARRRARRRKVGGR